MLGRVLKQSAGGLVKFPKEFICAILPTLYIVSYSCVAALHTNGKPSAPLLIRVFIVLWLMARSHQTFRLLPIVKLLGITLRNIILTHHFSHYYNQR
jgi:hypothetical protein